MDKVACGVIGAGWWGTTAHIPALKLHPHADLLAVQSRELEIAQKVASDFNVPHAHDWSKRSWKLPASQRW